MTDRTRNLLIVLAVLALAAIAGAADSNIISRLVIQPNDTAVTCATAASDGELCVSGDIESNANLDIAGTSTLTGAVTMTAGATFSSDITLQNGETIKNDNNGEVELGNGTEDTAFSWGTNSVILTSDTGVVELDVAAVGTTITLANDQTIVSDTNNEIQIGDNSEDISFGFSANTCTIDSDTGVVLMATSSISLGVVGPTLTSGGTDDYGVKVTQVLNDTGAAGGTDVYTAIKADITETDVTGWDNVYLCDLQVGSTSKFSVSDAGNVSMEGTLQVLTDGATIGWTVASAANQACTTTCAGTGGCVFGYDAGGTTLVACSSADADSCVCAGPAS